MSEKKPVVLRAAAPPGLCPVCGKASYSLNGTHPQCSVARADAISRAAQSGRRRSGRSAAQIVV